MEKSWLCQKFGTDCDWLFNPLGVATETAEPNIDTAEPVIETTEIGSEAQDLLPRWQFFSWIRQKFAKGQWRLSDAINTSMMGKRGRWIWLGFLYLI